MSNFTPMRVGEEETFTLDFAPLLAPEETISLPVWTMTAVDGKDQNASAMVIGSASISGTQVSQMIKALVPGVRYAPKCSVQTSSGQEKILPEYGNGLIFVTE